MSEVKQIQLTQINNIQISENIIPAVNDNFNKLKTNVYEKEDFVNLKLDSLERMSNEIQCLVKENNTHDEELQQKQIHVHVEKNENKKFLETGKLKADNIAYQVGSNDLDEKSAEEVVSDMKKLVLTTQRLVPGSNIIINELLPRYYNNYKHTEDYEVKRLDCNALLAKLCTEFNLKFVCHRNLTQIHFSDGIHLDVYAGIGIYVRNLKHYHVPLSVILKCNICHTERKSHKNFTQIGVKYRWENTSRDKKIEVLWENFIKQQIRDFEDSQFEQTFLGIDKTTSNIKKNIFESLANKACKIIRYKKFKQKILNRKPWVDHEVRDLKKTIKAKGAKLRREPFNLELKCNFFTHAKKLKKLVKRKKIIFKKKLFETLTNLQEKDPKKYWELLKKLKNEDTKQDACSNINLNNYEEHFQNLGKAEKYDNSFKEKVKKDLNMLESTLEHNICTDSPISISKKELYKKLKSGKSAGPDLISNEIIKCSSIVTVTAIVKLFNLILSSGIYPTSWRKAFIVLIHKSGDKEDIYNIYIRKHPILTD
ncbi:unnamed protein product [Mytilus coruscus]|uniref:Uncharacterized protein n=1 Tax=Mytilus coruscus TaxID=42192 RepID=A0A6J8CKC8_MYTCO|nr:unnamed protein product [Mytilus coruscus]